ncbi:MAG TPA: hypothetical protein PKY46_07680 [Ignavibacteriaceae bacterium]|nr:hypothetical protein [Ignavibacteriaceae bacterium]
MIYAFCGGASLALAVLSQQFYLIVIPFYLLFKLFSVKGRITLGLFIELSLFSIPFLPVIILFVVWNGLAHPNFQAWGLDFHIEYFTGILLVSGSVLFPYTIFKIKEIKRNLLISVILISVILSLFVFPIWSNTPIPGYISGLNFQAISRVESLNRFLGLLIKVFLISNGILGLILIVINKSKIDLFFLFMLLSFIIGFLISNMLSERHMLPLIVLLFLIVFKFLKDIKYPHLWAAWQALVGSVYFYYILFSYKLPGG